MHELQYHDCASFLTLTLNDANLRFKSNQSIAPSLFKSDVQLFLKRLRKYLSKKVSYIACGEYGDITGRPHYHMILYGWNFIDDRKHHASNDGHPLYVSPILDRLWNMGHCVIGDVTFDSISYVVDYSIKKLNGKMGQERYEGAGINPPFGLMSRNPAIGRRWVEDNLDEIVRHDNIIVNGAFQQLPKYYDEYIKRWCPMTYKSIKKSRSQRALDRLNYNVVTSPVNSAIRAQTKLSRKIDRF